MKKVLLFVAAAGLTCGMTIAKEADMLTQSRAIFAKNPHKIVPGHVLANVQMYGQEMEVMMEQMMNEMKAMHAQIKNLETKIDSMSKRSTEMWKNCCPESSKSCCVQ